MELDNSATGFIIIILTVVTVAYVVYTNYNDILDIKNKLNKLLGPVVVNATTEESEVPEEEEEPEVPEEECLFSNEWENSTPVFTSWEDSLRLPSVAEEVEELPEMIEIPQVPFAELTEVVPETVPEALETVPEALETVPEALETVPEAPEVAETIEIVKPVKKISVRKRKSKQ
jgi:hypothetical protein